MRIPDFHCLGYFAIKVSDLFDQNNNTRSLSLTIFSIWGFAKIMQKPTFYKSLVAAHKKWRFKIAKVTFEERMGRSRKDMGI